MSIDVERLSFSYGTHPVLRDVSFRAEPGQLVAVLGPNGAGKSTLFRCMLGFLPHYQGSISLCGRDVRHLPRRELAHLAAYIPQSSQPLFATPSGTRCLWAPPEGWSLCGSRDGSSWRRRSA